MTALHFALTYTTQLLWDWNLYQYCIMTEEDLVTDAKHTTLHSYQFT